jgi:aldose 1-epimerase
MGGVWRSREEDSCRRRGSRTVTPVVAPSGEQFEISGAGYRAVVTECGAGLRLLEHEGRPLVDGFAEEHMSSGGRGQLLMPWPNRIRDGQYDVGERHLQLPLSEPTRHNASHGLARWVAWSLVERTGSSVTMRCRLMAQSGYPWTLELGARCELGEQGLTVTQSATCLSGDVAGEPAPYAQGAHPYLTVGEGPCDGWELTVPAATRSPSDPDRKLPTGREPVDGTDFDFRARRPIGASVIDHAFTDLARDGAGRATVELRHPDSGRAVALWVDEAHPWVMVFTADEDPRGARRAVAVEPMTAQADAFRSGEDVVRLAPGDTFSASWGIHALA